MYDVKVLGQGIISITGENAQVIRLKREQIPQLKLGGAKGIYILWGLGKFYVGQGVYAQRLQEHFNNPNKEFSRVYLCTVKLKDPDYYNQFSHYLLDLEGSWDRYLEGIHGRNKRLNKQKTDSQELLDVHKALFKEWLDLVNIIDPTLLEAQEDIVISNQYSGVISSEDEGLDSLPDAPQLIDTHIVDEDIQLLKKYLQDKNSIGDSDIRSLTYKGYIKDNGDVRYLFKVWVISRKVKVEDPLGQLTKQEILDIGKLFDYGKVHVGYLTKTKDVPNRIYRMLVESGNLIQSKEEPKILFYRDELLDYI